MTMRQRLANRRASENFQFELDGLRYTATVKFDGRRENGETVPNNHKCGNASDTAVRDAAIILSFALQYGCRISMQSRRRFGWISTGRALGPVGFASDILIGE